MRLIATLIALTFATPALACGPDTDCVIGDRTYRLHLPANTDAPIGALFYAHGYRGSAAGAMNNAALRRMTDDLGIALVALKSAGDDWNLAHRPRAPEQKTAAEYDYIDAVIADVAGRVALDQDSLVFTGFSAGGMMTWTIACGMSERFAGFIPLSGTFWAPVPDTCTTPPTNIVHIHGTEDGVVPITGRPIGPTSQGDVTRALAMYAAYGGYVASGAEQSAPGGMTCRTSGNSLGNLLDFCTFAGGHDFSTPRLRYAYERIMGGS